MQNKEDAYMDFRTMIRLSWTYGKLTDEEIDRLIDAFQLIELNLKGSYKARFNLLHMAYHSFLCGVGYDGPNWRSEDEEETPLF